MSSNLQAFKNKYTCQEIMGSGFFHLKKVWKLFILSLQSSNTKALAKKNVNFAFIMGAFLSVLMAKPSFNPDE